MKLTAFAAVLAAVSALQLREEEIEEEECDFIGDFLGCCYDEYPEDACDEVYACMDGDINEEKLEGCVVDLGYDELSGKGSEDDDDDDDDDDWDSADFSGAGDDDFTGASGDGDDDFTGGSGSGDDADADDDFTKADLAQLDEMDLDSADF